MLDGAMMQVPQIKQAEPIRSKTNRDSSFLDSRTNLNADKREDSFQKKLDSKLDKGNRNQDKAPDKQADSKLPREREDHRGPHDSKMARKEIAQKPKRVPLIKKEKIFLKKRTLKYKRKISTTI